MPKRRPGREPKLPVRQLAILAVARFAEPLALTSVFPYLPEMIKSFGVDENDVASWAGFTGAVFSLAQSLTAVPWGQASDKYGRKPIILIGLISTMICFAVWGVSTSLTMAILTRAIQGAGNGNVGIIRTMVAEMVPEKELQPRAFSLMPLVWSIGSVFGPAFGGFFARPAEQYPGLFGNSHFFKTYPFALPNFVACIFFMISATTGALFLKETLESKRQKRDWGLVLGEKLTGSFNWGLSTGIVNKQRSRARRLSFMDDEAAAPLLDTSEGRSRRPQKTPVSSKPTMGKIFNTQTVINLIAYVFLAYHSVTYDQILPVFLNYPRQIPNDSNTQLPFKFSGGFGLSSDKIGTIYVVYGVACGVVQFLLFPPIVSRVGVLKCYRIAMLIFPLVYLVTPYTALIQDDFYRYAVFLFVLLVKGCVVIVGFPCTTILLTNSATSLSILGTLNGFATAFSGLGRAAGPAITGAVFSAGVQRGYMIAPWWMLAGVALLGSLPSWFIVEGNGPNHNPDAEEEEEEEEYEDDTGDETTVSESEEAEASSSGVLGGIIAGDATDLARTPEDVGLEPEDTDSDVEPLPKRRRAASLQLQAA